MAYYTSIVTLRPNTTPNESMVRRMSATLDKQGQIEPLQVHMSIDGYLTPFPEDPWGNEIIVAAQRARWPTLLVVQTERYEA